MQVRSLVLITASIFAQEIQGKVTKVSDGDTCTVTTSQNKDCQIRLYGIDAPENSQPYGDKAREGLSAVVLNKQVLVVTSGVNHYKRLIGKIYLTVGGTKVYVNTSILPTVKKQKRVKEEVEQKIYWLNTKSYKRHNSSCRWFMNTKNGRKRTRNEGSACKRCGG